jgi:hypothetical protein
MKTITTLTLIIFALTNNVSAQPNEKTAQEKMKMFSSWIGQWQGEGSMQMGPGKPKTSNVNERVEFKLNNTILVVEGIGKSIDETTKEELVVHHAYGIVSFDQLKNEYKFKTYLKDGRASESWFTPTGDNSFQWGFDIPNRGKTRYTIVIDPTKNTWNEIGEYSSDGTTWSKFFEMALTKQ